MKKVYFDDNTFIWKGKLNLISDKLNLLTEANSVMESQPDVKTDGFGYKKEWTNNIDFNGNLIIENKLDKVCQCGIDVCKSIYEEQFNTEFNKVNTDVWVNIVRSNNPVQIQFKHDEMKGVDKYHTHTEINKKNKSFFPHYTYVYYLLLPVHLAFEYNKRMYNVEKMIYFFCLFQYEYGIYQLLSFHRT